MRVVEPGLGDVDQRHGDAVAGGRAAVGLADVGAPRLVELLQRAGDVGQTDLGELGAVDLSAPFEHPEHIRRRHGLPRGQRRQAVQDAHVAHLRRDRHRVLEQRRLAGRGVGLAHDVALERQDAIVVGRTAPQHRAGRHEAALAGLHDGQVAGAAGLARDAQVARVDEADELRAFAVELRVAAGRIGRGRVVPLERMARQHMGLLHRGDVAAVAAQGVGRAPRAGIAAMAIGAAEHHARIGMHGAVVVGSGIVRVAAFAAGRLGQCIGGGLAHRGRWRAHRVGQGCRLRTLRMRLGHLQRHADEQGQQGEG